MKAGFIWKFYSFNANGGVWVDTGDQEKTASGSVFYRIFGFCGVYAAWRAVWQDFRILFL